MTAIISKTDVKQVRQKILSMLLPITAEGILQMTAGFISMAMIGRIDEIAIGALGLSMRITQIIWALFRGVATGAAVFVAQAYGADDVKKIRHVIMQTLLSSVILVVLFQIFIIWKAPLLLRIFNPGDELMINSILYLRVVSLGLPFMAIMLIVGGVLQAMGNAKTPMKIAIIMNFLNVGFGWILIFGKFGYDAMGIKGAAIALVIAQIISAVIGLYVLFGRDGVLSYRKQKELRLDFSQIKSIYGMGIPAAMEAVFWQISAIILVKIILKFGPVALAAYQLGLQAESISYMPAMGFGVASTAFIGQAIGAKDRSLGKAYMKELIKGCLMLTSISTIILIFFPSVVMRLLTDQVEVINIGVKYLIIMGLVQIPQNIAGVLNGVLRGAGYTKIPMIVAATGIWGIRIPGAFIVAYYLKMDISAIWIVMGLDLIFRFILSFVLYRVKDIYNNDSGGKSAVN